MGKFSEKFQRGVKGVMFNPKIYNADFGPLNRALKREKLQYDSLFWYSHPSLNVDAQLAAFAFAVLFRTKWTSNICHSNVSLHHFRRILQRHQAIFPVQRMASSTEDKSKVQHDMRKVKVCE